MSGRKILGSCVHIAAAITYLRLAKNKNFKIKGQRLKQVFIDTKKNKNKMNINMLETKEKQKIN